MRKEIYFLVLLLCLAPAAAQDDHSYTFDSGATFSYPHGWDVEVERRGGRRLIYLAGGTTKMMLLDADALEQIGIAADDLAAMLGALFSPSDEALTFDPDAVEWVTLGAREAAVYRYEDENPLGIRFENLIVALPLGDGTAGMVHAIPITGHDLEEEAQVLQIASSFRVGEPSQTEAAPPPTPRETALAKVYTFKSGAAFAYPRGWETSINEDGHVVLEGGRTRAVMGDAALLAERELPHDTPAALLEALCRSCAAPAPAFNQDRIETVVLDDGREAALYEPGSGDLLAAVPFHNGTMGFVHAAPAPERDLLLRILATFDDTSAVEVPIDWEGPACTLTSKYAPVNVREAPGTENPTIRQVDTWTDIYAVGQTLGEDKFIWFQLIDGGWVRQDTVMFEREACLALPEP